MAASPKRTPRSPAPRHPDLRIASAEPQDGLSQEARAVEDATTPREFLTQLDNLRNSLGLSYTQIANKAGPGMARSTAQAMLTGNDLPTRQKLVLFLRAFKISAEEVRLWLRVLAQLKKEPLDDEATSNSTAGSAENPAQNRHQAGLQPAKASATASESAPRAEPEHPATPIPRRPILRECLAVSSLVALVSASAIGMWLTHVPVQVIISAYSVVLMCVLAWTVVVRATVEAKEITLGPKQVKILQDMYHEKDDYGLAKYTVGQIAAEFGIDHYTVYRHL